MANRRYKDKTAKPVLTELCESSELNLVRDEPSHSTQPDETKSDLSNSAIQAETLVVKSETPPSLGPRYDILGLVGTGGMGTVWKVHDKELNEDFAIKVLKPELVTDETALKRFQKEANLASELTHANIAAIFGPGEDGAGRPYIIMRYVDGESLADILKREGKLSEERAMDIFSQLCEALSHSHMKGIIHRDIKPSNIIISKTESGADLVQLVDFGIARCVYDEVTKTQALTKAVDVFGSPRYMSPEQLLGQEVNAQSDIYSLGVVLYEMLTGAPPFTAENPVELIMQQIEKMPAYSQFKVNCRLVVEACLHKKSEDRPTSIDVLARLATITLEQPSPEMNKQESFNFFRRTVILTCILMPLSGLGMGAPLVLLCIGFFAMAGVAVWKSTNKHTRFEYEENMHIAENLLAFGFSIMISAFIVEVVFMMAQLNGIDPYSCSILSAASLAVSLGILFPLFNSPSRNPWLKRLVTLLGVVPNKARVYDTLSKHPEKSKLLLNHTNGLCCLLLGTFVSSLAVFLGALLQEQVVASVYSSFAALLAALLASLVALMLTASAPLTSQIKAGNGKFAKSFPSASTQIAIVFGIAACSFIFSGVFVNAVADNGIEDYIKATFAENPTSTTPNYSSIPVPSRPGSYFGALAMIELPPYGLHTPLTAEAKTAFDKALGSNLHPLLKAAVVASSVWPLPKSYISLESDHRYFERLPLINRALSLLDETPELYAPTPASEVSSVVWLNLSLQKPDRVSKLRTLTLLARAATDHHDPETLRRVIERMKVLARDFPNDWEIKQKLTKKYFQDKEKILADIESRNSARTAK